ncbi:MAG: DsrE family protein [Verrucomicrobiales bacterium]|nr:DsrE family protein [Verrucomicrobiales bacterium]
MSIEPKPTAQRNFLSLAVIGVALTLLQGNATGDEAMQNLEKHPSGHDRIPIQVRSDLKIVYQVSDDKLKGEVNRALYYAKKLLDTYNANGVVDDEIDLHLVFHGKGTNALVDKAARERLEAEGGPANPNLKLIEELTSRGVSIELCESSMEQREVESSDLVGGIATVRGAFPRIISLQHLGYAYIKFE